MFWNFIAIIIMFRLVLSIVERFKLHRWMSASRRNIKYAAGLFLNNFIDSKVLFVLRYRQVPGVSAITQIDATKAYEFIMERLHDQVIDVHRSTMFDHNDGNSFSNMIIIEMTNKRMIEMGNGYVEVLHTNMHYEWVKALLLDLAAFRVEVNAAEEKVSTVLGFARAMEMN